jgi:CBS domain-containing protein
VNINEVSDFIGSLEAFSQLTEVQADYIAKKIRVSYYAAGNSIEPEEGRLLLVRTGSIAVVDPGGKVVDILQCGDFHGSDLLPDGMRSGYGLRCEDDSLVYFLAEDSLELIMQQNSALREFFTQMSERKLYQQQKHRSRINTTRVGDIFAARVVSVSADASIRDAVEVMASENVSSLLIVQDSKLAGILTDKDLRKRVLSKQLALDTAVGEVMTAAPWTVTVDSLLFNALELMCRHNVHHLPVTDRSDNLVGMVSATDLIHNLQTDPVNLISDIHRQQTLHGLVAVSRRLRNLMEYIWRLKLPSYLGSQIITTVTDALTVRLIEIFIKESGPAPCLYSWMAFGSQARHEQAMNADQDNALLLEHEPQGEVGSYFEALATFVCDGLKECGIRYCPGGIMAKNPDHRLSLRGWTRRFETLLQSPTPDAVMHASIYFDSRCIAGSHSLFNGLQQDTLTMSRRNELFLYHLADNATKVTAPIGFFKNLVLDKKNGKDKVLDLKSSGLILIVDLVRVYSLNAGQIEVNTRQRLMRLESDQGRLSYVDPNECRNLLDSFDFLSQLRWDKHHADLSTHQSVSNSLNPQTISALQRQQLKDVFVVVSKAQNTLRHRFCRDTW